MKRLEDYIYYKNKIDGGIIYNGHCLDILRLIPDNNIDCIMTSPPYWSLRNYQTSPQIWGGDKNCQHNWEIIKTQRKNASGGYNFGKLKVKGKDNYSEFVDYKDRVTYSNFCNKCGAWRGELGLEPTFDFYINHLCDIFDEIKRVLKKDGTCWINMGDTYYGSQNRLLPDKCLTMIPERFAIEMINRGWILRNKIVWQKPNCMPSSIKDRFTVDWEYIYFFTKSKKYYFEQQFEPFIQNSDMLYRKTLRIGKQYKVKIPYENNSPLCHKAGCRDWQKGMNKRGKDAVMQIHLDRGRNKRCIWNITTKPYKDAHFATFPKKLCIIPIQAGSKKKGIVLDPFIGSGTTAVMSKRLNRNWLGIELKQEYCEMAKKRIEKENEWLRFE